MMTYDEACRILAPWIQAGKDSQKTDPMYGPGPRLWGCEELGVFITYIPHSTQLFKKFHVPQFQFVEGVKPKNLAELQEAATVFSAKLRGPSAFM